ncbi:hypothetical protein [Virgibacillus sp. YIM 98842]|uniref:hypothetical protein n=1 Tax=Virgibacillus sp. YIM 98842 TaxID=2663533 RepID=UPI0013DBCC7C|nr:hypothetical protein [Virgibacillus sp. YIM 98842]
MKVRELIEELLDFPMDSNIEVELDLNDDTEWEDFEVQQNITTQEIYLEVNLRDKVLIDADEYEKLKELEDEINE